MADVPRPHRPSYQDSTSLEALAARNDPIERLHAAHDTAAALVHAGHASTDPVLIDRIVAVVDEIGVPTLADLWESRPARSLPGALYRRYLLREWIDRQPETVAREYAAGLDVGTATLAPDQVRATADEILRGAFTGDVAEALDQAARFCHTVAVGRGKAPGATAPDERLHRLSSDLAACAALWRRRELE